MDDELLAGVCCSAETAELGVGFAGTCGTAVEVVTGGAPLCWSCACVAELELEKSPNPFNMEFGDSVQEEEQSSSGPVFLRSEDYRAPL